MISTWSNLSARFDHEYNATLIVFLHLTILCTYSTDRDIRIIRMYIEIYVDTYSMYST